MMIAASVLLPVLFTIAIGFSLEHFRPMEARTLSTLSLYVLTPTLVFYSLSTTHLGSSRLLKMILFLPLLTLGLWALTRLFLWIRKDPPSEESPTMMGVLFMNAGNFGIPMCKSAFGPAGVEYGVVWVVIQNSLLLPLAIYYAARDTHGARKAVLEIFKLPLVYAFGLAVALRGMGITLPEIALETIRSIGYAMIPVAQILLGVQLKKTSRETHIADLERVRWVCLLRLVASPLLGVALASALGATGLTRNVLLLLSGTPTAVNMTILAVEFNNRPHFVAAVVFFTTILSFLTLSVTLSLLHR